MATRSASPGTIGWPDGTAKVGVGGLGSPGSRREAAWPRPERRAKNCLTMRSSSEWKVTTASRPPSAQHRLGGEERARELAQFVVDGDAQGLKAARRRVRQFARFGRSDTLDHLGELQGGAIRRRRPVGDDGAGDAPRGALFAIVIEDVGDGLLVLLGEDVGRGAALVLHAHVERRVVAQGEAARGFVELHGGDADVEHDAVEPGDSEPARDDVELAETSLRRG